MFSFNKLISAYLFLCIFHIVIASGKALKKAEVDNTRAFTEQLLDLLEQFRSHMHEEIPNLGLPILEPLSVSHYDFDLSHEIGRARGHVDKVKVSNLSNFVTNEVDFSLAGLKFVFDLSIPVLGITGDYDVTGNFGDLFDVDGKGPFLVQLVDLNVRAVGKLKYTKVEGLSMSELKLEIKLSEVLSKIEGLMGGDEELGQLFNKIISEIAPEALDMLWPEFGPGIEDYIKENASDQLKFLTPQDILDIINGNTSLFPPK